MLTVAFCLYCMHTFIDSTQEPRTTVSVILEESAKLFSCAFLAISMLVGLLDIIAVKGFEKD